MNPFDHLGIPQDSTPDAVRSAYRKLVKSAHPDQNPDDPKATERFVLLQEVYTEALRLASAPRSDSSQSASASRSKQPPRHRTVYREVFIDVAQALSGTTVEIDGASGLCEHCSGTGRLACSHPVDCVTCSGYGIIKTQSKGYITIQLECHECFGTGRTMHVPCHHCGGFGVSSTVPCNVEIPANVRDGDAFRVDGVASIPEENVRGDIEFVVHIRDERFRLEGDDIVSMAMMDIWQAARGDVLAIPLPAGGSVRLTVPPGTADGRRFTSKGKGMPAADGGEAGNFVVVASIRPISVSNTAIDQALKALEQAVKASRQRP